MKQSDVVSDSNGSNVSKITSINPESGSLELKDGTVKNIDDVVFKSEEDATLYYGAVAIAQDLNALGIDFDVDSANSVVAGIKGVAPFNGTGLSASEAL